MGVERGERDDGEVARLLARAKDAQHLVAVRRGHHQIEQDDRGADLVDDGERLAAAPDRNVSEARSRQRLDEHVATDGVVIDDQDGPVGHSR